MKSDQILPDEIKNRLIDTMLGFIEERIKLKELIKTSATIKKRYNGYLPKDTQQAVDTIHSINEDLHNPAKKQLTKGEIIYKIDDLLLLLTQTH